MADALSQKERVKPLRVRDLVMTVHTNLPEQILNAQTEAMKKENRIWLSLFGGLRDIIMNELHKTSKAVRVTLTTGNSRVEVGENHYGFHHGTPENSKWAAPLEALYGQKCRSPVCWSEVGDSQLTSPKMIREMTKKIMQIKNRLSSARSRQKSYADRRLKPLEFNMGDKVMLKISPWKGVIRFGKRRKFSLRYVGPFKIIARVGPVA
ncbi:hypothetical protein Tco_1023666 [Tanacetum coccineum]